MLSVPDTIEGAHKNESVAPYFICLNNEVIGYAALIFDEKISKEEGDRYWLWQFSINKGYQNKGYASEALKQIIQKS